MKCKGRLKDKKVSKLKNGSTCNAVLDDHAIFCSVCGTTTEALQNELSARKVFKGQIKDYREKGMKFSVPGILLMVLTLVLFYSVFFLTAKMYYVTNLILLFLIPFMLIPFTFKWEDNRVEFSLSNYLSALRYYPLLWLFTLLNVVYYFLLKILCTGYLLTVATDPILHLVRLVLAIYWLAVIFPVPYIIINKKISLLRALKISYQAGAETRWQHFYLLLFVIFLNLVAIIPLGFGLIFTLPFSYQVIYKYSANMDQFELFAEGRV
jgi:hypothetical protein